MGGGLTPVEKQLVYFTATADWAIYYERNTVPAN